MECAYHPSVQATTQCAACQLGLCARCAECKPLPSLGFAAERLRTWRTGQRGGQLSRVYYCRETCQAYRAVLRAQEVGGRMLKFTARWQLFWGGIALAVLVAVIPLAGYGIYLALSLEGSQPVKPERAESEPLLPSKSSVQSALTLEPAGPEESAPAASVQSALTLEPAGPEESAPAASPQELPVDLNHVSLGQRYVFEKGSGLEVWEVTQLEGSRVRYLASRVPAGRAGQATPVARVWQADEHVERLMQFSPDKFRAVEYPLGPEWSFPALARDMGGQGAEYTYAFLGGRMTFPGLLERRHEDGATSWRLLRVERPTPK